MHGRRCPATVRVFLKELTAMTTDVELLTTGEVAKVLKVGPRSVWRWSHTGRMPRPVKIWGAVRFRADELRVWVADGCPDLRRADR